MSDRTTPCVLLVVGMLLSVPLCGQEPDEAAAAQARLEAWIESVGEAVSGVRFDEGDVESFLQHWPEFEALGEDESESEEDWEELRDLDWILEHARYRAWVASRGLDGRDWLLKSMRIMLMSMRDQMQMHAAMVQEAMPQQMAEIEAQCAQMGEELCAQMKASMAASSAMMASSGEFWEQVPEPTERERSLLERYGTGIRGLLEGGDEEAW